MDRSEAECQNALCELAATRVRLSEVLGNWSSTEARIQDEVSERLKSVCENFSSNALSAVRSSVESMRKDLLNAHDRKVCYLSFSYPKLTYPLGRKVPQCTWRVNHLQGRNSGAIRQHDQ